ncbi:hypothetical protein [Luteolibacter sp. LG18]|uniref:hypothetical protein n=1 Tax=Luteolibacter sp. LG18 TaxID=2819286 RepID=UPI002B2F3348|nr:hypothetical protein llg_27060 [Luteolibacter sp. LG18]
MNTNPNILAGYSMEMLRLALRDLGRTIRHGNAGRWEKQRFRELAEELERRELLDGAEERPPPPPSG